MLLLQLLPQLLLDDEQLLLEEEQLDEELEQLEVDWKYVNDPVQAADNEIQARIIIREVFRENGLEVTFQAKPIHGVAGSGEHTHVGMGAILKNGKFINLSSCKIA